MKYKDNVNVFGIRPELVAIFPVIEAVWRFFNNLENCVITSASDGKHSKGSRHYLGCAVDVRIWGFEEMGIPFESVAEKLREWLPLGFDVVVEQTHIHIEYDPKTGVNQ